MSGVLHVSHQGFTVRQPFQFPCEGEDAAHETLAPLTHLPRQVGSSGGKTTFPFLLFLSLRLDSEETNPHSVTAGLTPPFARAAFPGWAHISLPREEVSPRGEEAALRPPQAGVGTAPPVRLSRERCSIIPHRIQPGAGHRPGEALPCV